MKLKLLKPIYDKMRRKLIIYNARDILIVVTREEWSHLLTMGIIWSYDKFPLTK